MTACINECYNIPKSYGVLVKNVELIIECFIHIERKGVKLNGIKYRTVKNYTFDTSSV